MRRSGFLTEGEVYDKYKTQAEYFSVVGNNFFKTMEIPILEGRSFHSGDTATSLKVAIINSALARQRFPNQNPIGKYFATGGLEGSQKKQWIQVVGVCADTRYYSLRDEPPPQFFLPYVQRPDVGGMNYQIRSQLSPEALAPSLREAMHKIDAELPLLEIRTQEQQIAAETQVERIFVTLTSGFGVLGTGAGIGRNLRCDGILGGQPY